MSLTVLSVAYPFAPVSLDAVGGAEQVVATLDDALVAAGHRSIVLARADSDVRGLLVGVPTPRGEIDDAVRAATYGRYRQAIRRVLRERDVDVVHMHGIDFHAYLPPTGSPVLVTLHLPLNWYPPNALSARPGVAFNCVSAAQRRTAAPNLQLLPDIENGVPDALFDIRLKKRRYALALGRICPEKGFHLALEAARGADIPLLVAGEVFPYAAHRAYFEEAIRPRLDSQRRFVGAVGFTRKRRLLAAAQCVVVPSLAPETASLTAVEALASGTPVVAFPSGALADLIQHGRTGFLVGDVDEMAAAIVLAGTLRPEDCRAAVAHMRVARMTFGYVEQYHRLIHEMRSTLHGTLAVS
ncbi:MAG TPA: glycosyltransferase [Alphaproteobacteria bacterium]